MAIIKEAVAEGKMEEVKQKFDKFVSRYKKVKTYQRN